MTENMLHCDGRGRAAGHHLLTCPFLPHTLLAPRRNEPVDRVGQLKTPLLPQHHQSNRGNRLGHGINAENRIVAHALIALSIHQTHRLKISGYTVSRNQNLATRNFSRIDVVFSQVRTNSRELLFLESRSRRIYFHAVLPRYSRIEIPHW